MTQRPKPWKRHDSDEIFDADGAYIAVAVDAEAAKEIVNTVNSAHAAMEHHKAYMKHLREKSK